MKQHSRNILFLIVTILTSCSTVTDCKDKTNLLPMYGGLKKCDEQMNADQAFIVNCNKTFKNRDIATKHHIEQGWEYFYSNNFDSAMIRFNQAWLLDSTNADIYWGFGNILGMKYQFRESIPFLQRSIKINPKNPKVYESIASSYGQVFFETKDSKYLDLTVESLKNSLNLNPNSASVCAQLAGAYSYFNQKDSARKYLRIADKLDPNSVNPEVRSLLTE